MTKKVHWAQTEEGRERMRQIAKSRYNKANKRKYTKRKKTGIAVTISGPDTRKALNELISNSQYEKLNVTIMISKGVL